MTAQQAKTYIDKAVMLYDIRYRDLTPYILRAVRRDRVTGRVYAVLQDTKVAKSYVRARCEDLREAEI